ncbi:MAG: hypothetical protein IH806_07995 [Proteobacteria bacterium]|nr:hypothetical protein [Pseudomonadota bacterium]
MEADGRGPEGAVSVVHTHLLTPDSGWSIGTFGALAEFSRGADEPAEIARTDAGGRVATARGALRIGLKNGVRVVACESPGGHGDGPTRSVAFCLPEGAGCVHGRAALTEIGPDRDAIRPEHREFTLFDIGLGVPHVDFCLRTDDAALIAEIRRSAGQRIVEPGNRVLEAIKEASPHRVCISALGRIEVYQHIPAAGRHVRTPEGPHTHLLLGLLKAGPGDAADAAIPPGFVACLTLYPAPGLAAPAAAAPNTRAAKSG